MVSSEHTKLLTGRNSGQKEALKGYHLHLGAECAFHYFEGAFKQVLGCESSHVKSTTYYGIPERDVFPHSV